MHIYLLTESRYVSPKDPDWYVQQILEEDQILADALTSNGISSERVDWADPTVDWNKADAALFRTIWDYFERLDEFKEWFSITTERVRFINPPEQVIWNLDKHYLIDLQNKGLPIVPSVFIEQGDARSLTEICAQTHWNEFILKPSISASAYHTYRLTVETVKDHESIFKNLIMDRSMIIQEFQGSITTKGEVSHMVMGGRYTHSVIKKAKGEDFRVQDDFGGSVHAYPAAVDEQKFAESVFSAVHPLPAYGRVDVMWDQQGGLIISELEIIEPELWFREYPPAAQVLADHLKEIL